MSLRIDTTSWIPGALVIGNTGLGVLGSAIPSTGDNGPGYAYNDLTLPADAGKEICGRITTLPTNGTLAAEEDTSFEYVGTADTFEYQLYVDGVPVGSPATVTLSFGGVTHTSTASIVAGAATISASSARTGGVVTHASSGALVAQAASISATSAKYALHTSTGALVASAAVISSTANRSGGYVTHDSSGTLAASSAIIAAASIRVAAPVTHESSGALVAGAAHISGTAMNGTLIYARAPSGSGYRREFDNAVRPKQRNTTRP